MLGKNLAFLTFLLLFFTAETFAQKEAAVWYFGYNAGVDFNSGVPVPLTDGRIRTREGCSTISNSDGELLFYTDGLRVWDRNHTQTPNGFGLTGGGSSTQSAVIVPKPNDPDIYYIFTVAQQAGSNGFRYSEFDLTRNGGNGDVNGNKNIALTSLTAEKISAIRHSNGVDFWVVTHGWPNNNFLSYLVTANGVDPNPTISSVGSVHEGPSTSTIGYMKISPNGKRIALAKWITGSFVEVFDFDNSNGIVSDPKRIDGIFFERGLAGAYGLEFSPNSNLLYVSDLNGNNFTDNSRVFQFDISLNTESEIMDSRHILYDGPDYIPGIQLALDGKIYLANEGSGYLDIIEKPNVQGNEALYRNRAFYLGGEVSGMGLPPFIQSYFIDFEVENTCSNQATTFSLNEASSVSEIRWDFGDGATSSELNPQHTYQNSGQYTIQVNYVVGGVQRTIEKEISIFEGPIVETVTDFLLCDRENDGSELFDLDIKRQEILDFQSTSSIEISFFRSYDDAIKNENEVQDNYGNLINNETIFFRVTNSLNPECFAVSSFQLVLVQLPEVSDLVLKTICSANEDVTIDLVEVGIELLDMETSNSFQVTFHLTEDAAMSNSEELGDTFAVLSNPQVLYARVENRDSPVCYSITEFEFTIARPLEVNQPEIYFLCDDSARDGKEAFDLSVLNEEILFGINGNFSIRYFTTEANALSGVGEISFLYTNNETKEELYARVDQIGSPSCSTIVPFEIGVFQVPDISLNEKKDLCDGASITLDVGVEFDRYEWSTGSMESSIAVDVPGEYHVDLFKINPEDSNHICSIRKFFTIESVMEPQIEKVVITDFSPNNSIDVILKEEGDFEYSLDGITYQESGLFRGLAVGEYIVHIRDKSGCSQITKQVYLLDYPRFFTPNGDNVNDVWQIEKAQLEPGMIVRIFSRYGEIMKDLQLSNLGWDGTINGRDAPSDNYWFQVIRYPSKAVFSGHFALKR